MRIIKMKFALPLVAVGLIISALFILRGVPADSIPYPVLLKSNDSSGFKGRPIPYNEVLVAYRNWFHYDVIIYNDLNHVLTKKEFEDLDIAKIKDETKASLVIKNGPRFWVLDEIIGKSIPPRWTLQNHEFLVPGFVRLSAVNLINRSPYKVLEVTRDTKYVYYKNTKIYKLVSPSGQVFVMQAASQEVDPNLKLSDLEDLNDRLVLAKGWKYKVELLSEPLVSESKGKTLIVQDDLRNTYQLLQE